MLTSDRDERISMLNILCHPWFLLTEEELEEQTNEKKATFEKRRTKIKIREEEKKIDISVEMSTAEERKDRVRKLQN